MENDQPAVLISKPSHKTAVLMVSAAVLLLVATGFITYSWQHGKTATVQTELSGTNKKLAELQAKYDALVKAQASAEKVAKAKPSTTPTANQNSQAASVPGVAGLSIVNAQRYTPDSDPRWAHAGIAVQIDLVNNSAAPVTVDPISFDLMDVLGNTYSMATFDVQTAGYSLNPLPNNGVALRAQTLAPNAKLRGTLLFLVANTSLVKFTLVNGTQSYQLTAAD